MEDERGPFGAWSWGVALQHRLLVTQGQISLALSGRRPAPSSSRTSRTSDRSASAPPVDHAGTRQVPNRQVNGCAQHMVVDLWGGRAGNRSEAQWARDTLVMPYSVSKPLAAALLRGGWDR